MVWIKTFGVVWSLAQGGVASDTVMVTRRSLDRILAEPAACRPTRDGAGLWRTPLTLAQPGGFRWGQVRVLSDGAVAVLDADAVQLLLVNPNGTVRARFGRRGAGPGEFAPNSRLFVWAGDTVGVQDTRTARLSLFGPEGYHTMFALGGVQPLATYGAVGRFRDGALLFFGGLDPQAAAHHTGAFRPRFRAYRWNPGQPTASLVGDSIPGWEYHPVSYNGQPTVAVANFGRATWAAVADDAIVIYDNARPELEYRNGSGQPRRLVRFELPDQPVSQADRDSMTERHRLDAARSLPPPAVLEANRKFPKTRPAMLWVGADYRGGVWLLVAEPLARGSAVYLRVTAAGVIDRCVRLPRGVSVVGVGATEVVTATESAEGSLVNLARAVPPQIR